MHKTLFGIIVVFITQTIAVLIEGAAILAVWNLNIVPLFHQHKITFFMAMGVSIALSLVARILGTSKAHENVDDLSWPDVILLSLVDHTMILILILSAWVLSWFI